MRWVLLLFALFSLGFARTEKGASNDGKPVSVLSEQASNGTGSQERERRPSVPQPTSLYLVSAGVAGMAVLSARKMRN